MTSDKKLKTVGVIPARYDSVRLPGKLLSAINGRPLIQYTYESASKSKILDELIVAADDERIIKAVEKFGGKAVMTSKDHSSGTERIAELIEKMDCDIVVNIQGDEPTISAESIDRVAQMLADDPQADIATLAFLEDTHSDLDNTNVVKVVFNKNGYALYFSRAMIPHTKTGAPHEGATYYHHVGIYSYRRDVLLKLSKLPQSPLEKAEELEQLKAIENGYRIKVGLTRYRTVDVNTYEDLKRIREIL
jgi:3-deoxy-manno-octulosonate cytidylyltransferase (CMP-KDO synthetase)